MSAGISYQPAPPYVPGAQNVPAWYVDTNAGSDAASGIDPAAPLATIAEVLRRIGPQPVTGAVVVTITGDTIGPLDIAARVERGGALYFQGERAVLSSHTLTAVTAYNASTGVLGAYTLSGSPDLAAAPFVRLAASHGTTSPIVSDLGGHAFRGLWIDGWNTWGQVEPSNGAAVDLYRVPKVTGDVTISVTGFGYVGIVDLEIGTAGANHSCRVLSGGATFASARVHALDLYRPTWEGQIVGCNVTEFRSYGAADVYASAFGTVGGTPLAARGRGVVQIQSASLVTGGTIEAGNANEGPGDLVLLDTLFHDAYTNQAAAVFYGSTLRTVGRYVTRAGSTQAAGVIVYGGGALRYASGLAPTFNGSAPSTAYKVGGTSKATGAIPYIEAANGAAVVVDA